MHIPDGFLSGRTLVTAAALSTAGVGAAVWQSRRLAPRQVPLMGLSAAFVFAAQMLNFPVAGGTSGHLIGGVLTAVLLGPGAAILVLTAVLTVQCLLFADGGLLALGANVLNMGVVDSVGGYLVYRLACRVLPGHRGRVAAVAFAAWCGAVLASLVCAGELATSGTVPPRVAVPAMAGVHMLIGVGEALITALVLQTVWRARPELLDARESTSATAEPSATGFRNFMVYGLLIAIALALFVAPFACPWPDGLDHVAERLGFSGRAASHAAPIPDYHMPGVSHVGLATAAAGAAGTLVAFALALALARVLVPAVRRDEESSAPLPPAAVSS